MSKASSLAKNTAIIAVGKLSSQIVTFLLLPLYTHYLNPSEYGFADLAMTYILLLVPALTLQLEMASFRYLVDVRKDEAGRVRVLSNIVSMAIPLALPWLVLFAAVGLAIDFEYTWAILVTAVALLCSNMAQQMARGLGDNMKFAIASIFIGFVTLVGAVVFIALLDWKVDGMLLSIAAGNVVATLYLTMKLQLYKYIRFGERDKKLQREILGYSVPLVPNSVSWWVINASDRTIISMMIDTAANGIYAVASKYGAILNSFNSIFLMSWTEAASLHIDSPDRDKFFSQVANIAVRLFGAMGLGLIAIMPFVFPWMVNEEFNEAYLYIPIMIIGVLFGVIVSVYSAIYVAKKKTKQVMNTSLVAALLNIVLTIALVPFFGLYAAAGSTAVAFLAMAIYRHYDAKKYAVITYEKKVFVILAVLYLLLS
jgi:O-antigen/teichoic acid export membrane protein